MPNIQMTNFKKRIISFPNGSFYAIYNDSKYLVTKHSVSNGKILKIYAEQLKGNDIVSGNYFLTIKNGLLKPCEMSDKKVIDFVLNCVKHLEICLFLFFANVYRLASEF